MFLTYSSKKFKMWIIRTRFDVGKLHNYVQNKATESPEHMSMSEYFSILYHSFTLQNNYIQLMVPSYAYDQFLLH